MRLGQRHFGNLEIRIPEFRRSREWGRLQPCGAAFFGVAVGRFREGIGQKRGTKLGGPGRTAGADARGLSARKLADAREAGEIAIRKFGSRDCGKRVATEISGRHTTLQSRAFLRRYRPIFGEVSGAICPQRGRFRVDRETTRKMREIRKVRSWDPSDKSPGHGRYRLGPL